MSESQRRKGATAERELARLLMDHLGPGISRNLDQARSGGHDLQGLPVALEVKRYATASQGDIARWWSQTVEQAEKAGKPPALAYRADGQKWRFVVSLLEVGWACVDSRTIDWTAQIGIAPFCLLMRELMP